MKYAMQNNIGHKNHLRRNPMDYLDASIHTSRNPVAVPGGMRRFRVSGPEEAEGVLGHLGGFKGYPEP